jgi:hypothetical protein
MFRHAQSTPLAHPLKAAVCKIALVPLLNFIAWFSNHVPVVDHQDPLMSYY